MANFSGPEIVQFFSRSNDFLIFFQDKIFKLFTRPPMHEMVDDQVLSLPVSDIVKILVFQAPTFRVESRKKYEILSKNFVVWLFKDGSGSLSASVDRYGNEIFFLHSFYIRF